VISIRAYSLWFVEHGVGVQSEANSSLHKHLHEFHSNSTKAIVPRLEFWKLLTCTNHTVDFVSSRPSLIASHKASVSKIKGARVLERTRPTRQGDDRLSKLTQLISPDVPNPIPIAGIFDRRPRRHLKPCSISQTSPKRCCFSNRISFVRTTNSKPDWFFCFNANNTSCSAV
jgi:hypothetical protein